MSYGDAPLLMRWGSDTAFRHYQWGQGPGVFEEENARAWIERMSRPGDSACWVIERAGRPIGFANYRDHRPKGRSAEIGIGIGEPDLWGKHLGRDALAALLRHLLADLGLHRVGLSVVGFNDRAISMYKAVGFEVEGIERDGVGTEGGFVDDVKMAYVVGRAAPRFDPRPITLTGRHVRLEPMRMAHAPDLFAAVRDDDTWRYLSVAPPTAVQEIERYVRAALDLQIRGEHLAWVTRRLADGNIIGTTRYGAIDRANRSVEIGWTLLSADARRTAANTEAKYLQLRHAFDDLGALRVWLKTDVINERSQRAIERLGAVLEGVIRNERILPGGRIRDAKYYSIIDRDWPQIRARLERLLAR
jgi:RimJ/RimL family protein N-acetyltransferase